MRRHLLARLMTLALLVSLVLAPAAEAYNDGRGFYGETNDKVVTNAGFIVIVFFPLFVFLMSMLQKHLERRKEARIAAQKALLGNAHWRGGW
jgi:Zn-dependent protease with chaperone function